MLARRRRPWGKMALVVAHEPPKLPDIARFWRPEHKTLGRQANRDRRNHAARIPRVAPHVTVGTLKRADGIHVEDEAYRSRKRLRRRMHRHGNVA